MPKQLTSCPLCGDASRTELYCFEPARWIPGKVVRCDGCQAIYKAPSDRAKPLAEYYDHSYATSSYWDTQEATVSAFQEIRNLIVSVLNGDSFSLLDVGCGPGHFLSLMQDTGFTVTGLELNPTLAEQAKKRTSSEVLVGDVTSLELEQGRRFDVVTLLDVIEHLADPVAATRCCRDLLKPGGHLVVYTPNHSSLIARIASFLYRVSFGKVSGPVTEIFDSLHVVFFDAKSLSLTLKQAGLSIVKTAMLRYDPARSNQAKGASALGLRAIETVSPLIGGPFRLLMFARKEVVE